MGNRAVAKLGLTICCACVLPAHADVSFHGFGQIVAGSTLGDQHTTIPGSEYKSDPSFQPESLFALQVYAPLADRLGATAQVVAAGAQGNDFKPSFEWAYASYQVTDAWSLKAGRQRLPLYKYSDYLQVGQAYPWIRPPTAVYQSYISNIDGISATGYYEVGNWTVQPQLTFGNINKSFVINGANYNFIFNNDTTGNIEFGYNDWLSFRLGAAFASASVSISTLDPAIASIGQTCEIVSIVQLPGPTPTCTDPAVSVTTPVAVNNSTVVAGLQAKDDTVVFYNAGIEAHKYNFILISEYVGIRFNDSLIARDNEYYASLGYKWNNLTSMLTYGRSDQTSSNPGVVGEINNGSTPFGSGVPVAAAGPYTIAIPTSTYVTYLLNTQRFINDYYELGFRYDTSKSTAIKLDYTRYLNHAPSYTALDGTTTSPATGANLLSAAFVFVF